MPGRVRRFMLAVWNQEARDERWTLHLQDAVGRTESCPGSPCPFWEADEEAFDAIQR